MIGWAARYLAYGHISSDAIQFPGIQILGVIQLRKVVVYGFLEFGSKHPIYYADIDNNLLGSQCCALIQYSNDYSSSSSRVS